MYVGKLYRKAIGCTGVEFRKGVKVTNSNL